MGRDWLSVIRIDWASIKALALGKPPAMDSLQKKYPNGFAPGLGTMKEIRANLSLKEGARPRFFRPRTVPFALRDRVGKELDRLEASGALRKVNYAEWAAPIVPVPKKDGTIRICGHYKVTVNLYLHVDQYPCQSHLT